MMLPVYLFTGFLDAGKTTFLQSMLEDPGFNEGQRTLVLLCEEGEEELEPKRFSINNVTIRTVDSVAELTPANMSLWQRKAAATRVMIEYNGMWQMNDLFDRLPDNWGIETMHRFTEDEIRAKIAKLDDTETYGTVLRAKGVVPAADGEKWIHFDHVPGEVEIRRGAAGVIGRLCVIGSKMNEDALKALFTE